MSNNKALEVIDEIKNYLFKYNHEKFYGLYRYNKKDYKASNLLFSLLISERLSQPFNYFEDINIDILYHNLNNIVLSKYKDEVFKTKFVKFLKEIIDITDQVVRMNGVTFSYHEILSNKINFDDLKEDLENKLNDDMRFSLKFMEEKEKEVLKRLKDIRSPLGKLVDSKARGSGKQLAQEFLSVGYKVDNQSNILKKPILASYMEGIYSEEDFYTAAIGCRNAIIQGTTSVSNSGYLNRKLSFGSINIDLSNDKDCKTENFLKVKITESNYKVVLVGRYIQTEEGLKNVNINTAKDYIGSFVNLRSPITCKSKDGICKTCYGNLYTINKGFSIGLLSATSIAEIATQKLLSTKHLLSANISPDNPIIMEHIEIDHNNDSIKCIRDLEMDLIVSDPMKIIFNIDGKEIEFEHNFKNLSIHPTLKINKETGMYNIKKGDVIFNGIKEYVNKDMNKLMKVINRNFERTNEVKDIEDINQYFDLMLGMLLDLGNIPSLHLEVIMSQMFRLKENNGKLWRLEQDKEYDILSVRKSNLSGNLFNSILFERVKESLLSLDNYTRPSKDNTKYEKLFISK